MAEGATTVWLAGQVIWVVALSRRSAPGGVTDAVVLIKVKKFLWMLISTTLSAPAKEGGRLLEAHPPLLG